MTLSASQVAIRSTGIGASDIGAVCGLSFWKRAPDGSPCGGPHSVYLAKRGLVVPSSRTIDSETGDDGEFLAERRYRRVTGLELAPLLDANGEPLTMRHPDHSWVLASIDRVRVVDWIPVEVKFMSGLRAHYHEGRDENRCSFCDRPKRLHWRDPNREPMGVPDDVFAQVQWQMLVCGAPFADVARFWLDWDGLHFSIYRVNRSEKVITWLFDKGNHFWHEHVLKCVPPDPDPSDDSEKCERTFAPNVLRKMVPAPRGTEQHIEAFLGADERIRASEKQKKEAANWIRRIVGSAEGLTGDNFVVTNRKNVNGSRLLRVKRT